MKTIFILMDSLNRHYLSIYGNNWVKTPNIERYAKRSIIFDNHWLGSAPCMPARRDILIGRLNFLERDWGGLEPFDIPFTRLLRNAGIFSHLVTDHYHYFHTGGENYHTAFDSWEFYRGQENDAYISRIKKPEEPEHLGKWRLQYALNKTAFKSAGDYPSPKTMAGAVKWLKDNEGADDYLLWVEAFDPHEPFDCPEQYVKMYDTTWDGPLYNWSGYEKVEGNSEATRHLQKQYAGTLTMLDEWFGKLLDEIEQQNGFKDTLIILTSDHGHMLGEHNCTGKNRWQVWNEMAHIPLIVHLPGSCHAGEHRTQLTQNIDIMPTVLKYFNVPFNHEIHGRSLMDILENNDQPVRESALYGWFGKTVNVTDGKYTYLRAAAREDNQPLFVYFQMPTTFSFHDVPGEELFQEAELGDFLPYINSRVLRAPLKMNRFEDIRDTLLFDIQKNYGQTNNLAGTEIEKKYIELLIETMKRMDSPTEQFERLCLK